jgi:hypothetical protein
MFYIKYETIGVLGNTKKEISDNKYYRSKGTDDPGDIILTDLKKKI